MIGKTSLGFALSSLIAVSTFPEVAMANCRDKCINRIAGTCVARVKVCDIGSPADWLDQENHESTKVLDGVTKIWHDIYGVMPDHIREVLNNNAFTLIGGYFGGLEGAALGQAVDQLLQGVEARMVKTKAYIESSPDWKEPIYKQGLALSTIKDRDIVGTGQASKQDFALHVDTLYDRFLTCVQGAADMNAGWECYNAFEDGINVFVREARKQ